MEIDWGLSDESLESILLILYDLIRQISEANYIQDCRVRWEYSHATNKYFYLIFNFSKKKALNTFGIWSKRASRRWIEILGFALSTSKIISILEAVDSQSFALWLRFEIKPDRKNEFPIFRKTFRAAQFTSAARYTMMSKVLSRIYFSFKSTMVVGYSCDGNPYYAMENYFLSLHRHLSIRKLFINKSKSVLLRDGFKLIQLDWKFCKCEESRKRKRRKNILCVEDNSR